MRPPMCFSEMIDSAAWPTTCTPASPAQRAGQCGVGGAGRLLGEGIPRVAILFIHSMDVSIA